jgi:hypothetical protein
MYRHKCLSPCRPNLAKVACTTQKAEQGCFTQTPAYKHDPLVTIGLDDSDTAVHPQPSSTPQEIGFIIEMDCVLSLTFSMINSKSAARIQTNFSVL